MPRPIRALVDTQALSHNLAIARSKAPGSKVWAVVKANAYGHDINMVYPALKKADGFALLDFDEAVRIRELGWTGPILLLEGFFESRDLAAVVDYRLTPAVSCNEHLDMLAAISPTRPIPIYLKMNSGMNRLGFPPAEYRSAWQRARAIPSIGTIGLMTHFAEADGAPGVQAQLATFDATTLGLEGERSLSNSAATLWHEKAHSNWIRPGVMLYGASPSGLAEHTAGTLQAVMTLQSTVIGVQHLQAGDKVGYGGTFIADKAMRIGVVACGYADGYPRVAPNGTPVVVDGIRTHVVGRVSMDMLTVDLSHCPQAGLGSSVELWGKQLPIDEVAQHCGTVGYELMTAVAPRVERVSVSP